jgi:hypothetical protein
VVVKLKQMNFGNFLVAPRNATSIGFSANSLQPARSGNMNIHMGRVEDRMKRHKASYWIYEYITADREKFEMKYPKS